MHHVPGWCLRIHGKKHDESPSPGRGKEPASVVMTHAVITVSIEPMVIALQKNARLIQRNTHKKLYATLHELDDEGVDVIIVQRVPSDEPWQAVADRLSPRWRFVTPDQKSEPPPESPPPPSEAAAARVPASPVTAAPTRVEVASPIVQGVVAGGCNPAAPEPRSRSPSNLPSS